MTKSGQTGVWPLRGVAWQVTGVGKWAWQGSGGVACQFEQVEHSHPRGNGLGVFLLFVFCRLPPLHPPIY